MCRAEPSRAEPSRAEPGRAEPSRVDILIFKLKIFVGKNRRSTFCFSISGLGIHIVNISDEVKYLLFFENKSEKYFRKLVDGIFQTEIVDKKI